MIQQFKDTHKGETCLVIGNGPSLDVTPLEKLAGKYPSFGANKIYDSVAHPDFMPDYWTCIDDLMLTDCVPYLLEHPELAAERFVPRTIPMPKSHGLNTIVEIGFSKDAAEKVYLGGTVTYVNLQLAYYMGFTRVLLVGIDHRYPHSSKGGTPGSRFIAKGQDMDHFASRNGSYFQEGRIYNRPELDAIERYFFPLAKRAFNGQAINLTPNSAENVFEKGEFDKWL
jgi:hypothetical protein